MIILFPAALLKWFDCKSCAIYGISKHENSCLLLSKIFLFIPYASRCSRFQKEEGRGEGKGKPEGDGEKIIRIMLGKIFRRSDKTEKALSARAKQMPQISYD